MISELKNKTIGVFFGGQNPEHEISIITGEFILAELKHAGYKAVGVYISKKGAWYLGEEIDKLKFFKGDYEKTLTNLKEYSLKLSTKDQLVLEHKSLLKSDTVAIDFAFPAFHGMYGEDGTVQGLYEFFNTAYAGCGIYTSSLSINKVYTKNFLKGNHFNTTHAISITKSNWKESQDAILETIEQTLTYPLFAKPARTGSSIGISKAKNKKELVEAIELALYYDTEILVENGVENLQDLTCAVLSGGTNITASEVQESLFGDADMFDYSVKYLEDGGAQTGNAESNLIIPANIDTDLKTKIQETSKEIFKMVAANGTMRIDFLHNTKTGELFVNEFNTLPGTLYHHLWEKSGIDIATVLEKMLKHGLERNAQYKEIAQASFSSTVLDNANSLKLQQKS